MFADDKDLVEDKKYKACYFICKFLMVEWSLIVMLCEVKAHAEAFQESFPLNVIYNERIYDKKKSLQTATDVYFMKDEYVMKDINGQEKNAKCLLINYVLEE